MDDQLILQELINISMLLEKNNDLFIALIATVFLVVGSILGFIFMSYLRGK